MPRQNQRRSAARRRAADLSRVSHVARLLREDRPAMRFGWLHDEGSRQRVISRLMALARAGRRRRSVGDRGRIHRPRAGAERVQRAAEGVITAGEQACIMLRSVRELRVIPCCIAEPPRTPWDLNFQVWAFPFASIRCSGWWACLLGFSGRWRRSRNSAADLVRGAFCLDSCPRAGPRADDSPLWPRRHISCCMRWAAWRSKGGRKTASARPGRSIRTAAFSRGSARRIEQILISAAGPGIQFVLLGLIIAIIYATGGHVEMIRRVTSRIPEPVLGGELWDNNNLISWSGCCFKSILLAADQSAARVAARWRTDRAASADAARSVGRHAASAVALGVHWRRRWPSSRSLVMHQYFTMMLFASLAAVELHDAATNGRRPATVVKLAVVNGLANHSPLTTYHSPSSHRFLQFPLDASEAFGR